MSKNKKLTPLPRDKSLVPYKGKSLVPHKAVVVYPRTVVPGVIETKPGKLMFDFSQPEAAEYRKNM